MYHYLITDNTIGVTVHKDSNHLLTDASVLSELFDTDEEYQTFLDTYDMYEDDEIIVTMEEGA